MAIHQVLVSAGFGDAITDEALSLRPLLAQRSESHVFARIRDPLVRGVLPLEDLAAMSSSSDTLLFHPSVGDEVVFEFLRQRPERLVIRYHNITPARFLRPFHPEQADRLELGLRQVAELKERVLMALAVSTFNAEQLSHLGYRRIEVVPLLANLRRLTGVRPQMPRLPMAGPEPKVLFVGRLAPNKCQHLLVQAFHVLTTYHRPDAKLILAGGGDAAYVSALHQFIRELALPGVILTGRLETAELAALYRQSDVFLCLSAHEGFCVPLLEAMAFDLPIVAWTATAVGETLGGAGIPLAEPGPAPAAEAVRMVLEDNSLRRRLIAQGRERLRDFAPDRVGRRLLEALDQVA